jgi:hypothetical protein
MGELRSLFADWEILVYREDEIAEVVARRSSRGSRHPERSEGSLTARSFVVFATQDDE